MRTLLLFAAIEKGKKRLYASSSIHFNLRRCRIFNFHFQHVCLNVRIVFLFYFFIFFFSCSHAKCTQQEYQFRWRERKTNKPTTQSEKIKSKYIYWNEKMAYLCSYNMCRRKEIECGCAQTNILSTMHSRRKAPPTWVSHWKIGEDSLRTIWVSVELFYLCWRTTHPAAMFIRTFM